MTPTPRFALVAALVAIAAGLVAVALLGPLTGGPVEYHVSETLRNQTIGLDAVSLFVVAPLAVAAAVLARRGHVAGPALALGVGAYTAYMFVQYIVGPEYLARPGDNERLFPLYLCLFVLALGSALLAWQTITSESGSGSRRRHRVLARVVLPLLALLAFSRYVPALADAMNGDPHDAGYRAGPTFFWTIAMLDLGIFLPATVLTCMALLRGRPWAQKALYLVVGWFGLVGPAVAAMAIAMYLNDDPNATVGNAIAMTILGLAFAMLAVSVYLPLCRSQRRTRPVTPASADTRGG
jgi:hypothetical protein